MYRYKFWFKRENSKYWECPMLFFDDNYDDACCAAIRFALKYGFVDFIYDDDLEVGSPILPDRDINGRPIGRTA